MPVEMKRIFIMLASFQSLLLITCLLCLTACWPLEENQDSSEPNLLPEINTNLSSESPAGIWMLEITANTFESFYYPDLKENSTDYSSDYLSHKFLIISEDTENANSFLINDCYPTDIPRLTTRWQLIGSTLSIPEVIDEETGIDIIDSVFWPSGSSQGELKLANNLALAGTQSNTFNTSVIIPESTTHVPQVILDYKNGESMTSVNFPKYYKSKLTVKGVKVSDETNFSDAAELNLQLKLSNSGSNNNTAQLKCISSVTKTQITILNDTEENTENNFSQISESSSNLFNIHFKEKKYFLVENLSEEGSLSNIITQVNEYTFVNAKRIYNSSCSDTECQIMTDFQQTSLLNSKGYLSTEVEYSTDDNLNGKINISIGVN